MIELLTSKLFCNDELKVVHIANFEVDLCSSSVEYCSISNVNSLYQCSCKQCCAIAVYAMRYSVVKIHVDTGLQELYLLVMGIHCTVWWVWKDNYYDNWSSWKWEYQRSWDRPYCLCCKQWCPMLQFGWEQICVEDVHFKTLSWSDRIFVMDWNILYKLCSSAKK